MDSINYSTGAWKIHSVAYSVFASNPAGVHEPYIRFMVFLLLGQHLSVLIRMKDNEGFSKASREGFDWVSDSYFGSCYFAGVSVDEVVAGLFRSQFAHGRKYATSIASQEDQVTGMFTKRWELSIGD